MGSFYTKEEALLKAQEICAQQEKCSDDIIRKLRNWGIEEEDIKSIIEKLIDSKFIDNGRFAESYAKDKFRFNKWGKRKIAFSLRQKYIQDKEISNALAGIDPDEYGEMVKDEIIKKHRSTKAKDVYDLKNKLLRFGAGRGFEPELIYEIIDVIIDK